MCLKALCLTSVLLAMSFNVSTAGAQSLSAAADGSRLWVLTPETDRPGVFTVYHHAYSDPPSQITKVQTLRGVVRPHCMAAADNTLWIIYPDGEVQAIRAKLSLLQDSWEYSARVEPKLPAGVSVRATALTALGPWALVRIEDPKTLAQIDALAQPTTKTSSDNTARRQRNLAIGLPPGHGLREQPKAPATDIDEPKTPSKTAQDIPTPLSSGITPPDTADPVAVPTPDVPPDATPKSSALPVDRLLYLRRGSWQVRPLPEDWPHGAEAWLVTESGSNDSPTLIARSNMGNASNTDSITTYRSNAQTPDTWPQQTYQVDVEADGITLLAVENQLVLAQYHHEFGQLTAELSILRAGKVLPVGQMTLDDVSATQWSILGTGNTATFIAQRESTNSTVAIHIGLPPLVWTQTNMRGLTALEPTDLILKTPSAMDDFAQYALLAFVVVLITVLMMAFWRRDAAWNRLDLPLEIVVADLPRRAAAAALDMAPGLLGAMAYFGLSLDQLIQRWPGNGIAQTAEHMLPGAIVIAIFVTHTTLTELVLGRSLGKIIIGLRTTTLTGTRPRAWQLLVRGLLKSLDLLPGAWLLLMLPVIAPHRQRLGDLVGRTVVVTDAPKEQPPDEQEDTSDD
jgi:uncharacterized RDD family membrane protein YckC